MEGALDLANRLRQCLRFDATQPEESELEHAAREAADSLEALAKWQMEGEKLMEKQGASAMFALGAWWADRPWRSHK